MQVNKEGKAIANQWLRRGFHANEGEGVILYLSKMKKEALGARRTYKLNELNGGEESV